MSFYKQSFLFLGVIALSACGGGGGGGESSTASADTSNPTPTLTIIGSPILKAEEDSEYAFGVTLRNASGTAQFEMENAPEWLKLSSTGNVSASVSGMPTTDADAGIFDNIMISATDGQQRTVALAPFRLEVTAVNDAPVITFQQTDLVLDGRESFTINYSVTDEEGDPFDVQLSGIADALNTTVSGTAIIGTADDVNEVRTGELGVSLLSAGETYNYGVDVKIFPVTADGSGRTIFGRKSGHGVNLVILGDGYTAQQMATYRADAEDFITEMHIDSGIVSHMPAWNVHVVETPSNESGADDDYGTDTTDTFFGSGYNCADIQRLICANRSTVFSTAFTAYPQVDEIILIVNDGRYGGSGGSFSIYARSAPSIALHEMGHSFADLRDEYVDEAIADRAEFFTGRIYANVSSSFDPNGVPWSHWIEDKDNYPTRVGDGPSDQVGIFEGALYNASGYYRPLGDSRMRSNNAFFGVVSTEQWIEQIYATAGPVSDGTPNSSTVSGQANEDVAFAVQPLFNSDIQKITWRINGVVQDDFMNEPTLLLNSGAGNYVVDVAVADVTGKVRKANARANYSRSWTVTLN